VIEKTLKEFELREGSRGIVFAPVAQDEGGERRIPSRRRIDDRS
jgi:hypothetical protein